jgi:hypothetical protein
MGKICDQVNNIQNRPVFANLAKMMKIIWNAQRPSIKLLQKILLHFPENIL